MLRVFVYDGCHAGGLRSLSGRETITEETGAHTRGDKQMTETEMLSDEQLKEIEGRFATSPVLWTDVAALCQTVRALSQWKREALPLLTRYDNLAETFGGKLGSSKVANLEQGVTALREQLAEAHTWTDRKNAAIETWQQQVKELQSQLAQVEKERDRYAEALESATRGIKCDD